MKLKQIFYQMFQIKYRFVLSLVFSTYIASTFFVPQIVFAQNKALEFPAIAINSLRMKEYVFAPGSPISVDMQVENIMSSASEFRYKVQLMPVDKKYLSTSTPQVILSSSPYSEQINLHPGEKRQIRISYNVPAYVHTNASLQVIAYNNMGIEVGSKQIYLWNSTLKEPTSKNGTASSSVPKVNQTSAIEIQNVRFTQGTTTFVPKGEGSAYLLKKDSDLKISVDVTGLENRKGQSSFILVDVSNIHATSSFSTLRYGGYESIRASTVNIDMPSSLFQTGVYAVEITPVDENKVAVGPSRKVTIGVEGITAIVQAFDVQTKLPIKKGDAIFVLADWIPISSISKILTAEMAGATSTDTVFDARITLEGEAGVIVASSTISSADFNIQIPLIAESSSKTLTGKIQILVNGKVVAEYVKEVLVPVQEESNSYSTKQLWMNVLYIIVFGVVLLIIRIIYKRRVQKNILSLLVLFSISISTVMPTLTYSAWTQLGSSYSFDHLYPEAYDSSSSTWQTGWLGGSQIPGWSLSCTKRTATSGSNSNYVAYTNSIISSNNKMYRGEYAWHKVSTNGLVWYWVDQTVNYEVWPPVYPAGPYTRSAFVHESMLKRVAKLFDNMNYPGSDWNTWRMFRPFRLSVSSDPISALDTTNYSNLNQWLQINYSTFREYSYPVNRDYANNNALAEWIPGVRQVYPPEAVFNQYSEPQYMQKIAELGIESTDLITDIDAGSFLSPSVYKQTMYGLVGDSSGQFDYDTDDWSTYETAEDNQDVLYASRPATYKLFNFLYTTRDEIDYTDYDCVSSNMKVFTDSYEVVANSFINIVIFNDKNGNGVKDAGEKSISNISNPDGYIALPNNGIRPKTDNVNALVTCDTAQITPGDQVYPNYYESASADISFLNSTYDFNTYTFKNAVVEVTSSDQVITPAHIIDVDQNSYLYNPVQTPFWWGSISGYGGGPLSNRGFGNPYIYYDEQGKAKMYSGYTGCLHIVQEGVQLSAWPEEYNDQVNLYPVSESVTDGTIAYHKIPVNTELSSEYTVQIDQTMLPSGWVPTKEASAMSFEKVVSVTNANTNDVVYLGIKYDAPQGQCGIATSTVQLWEPYENLCAENFALNGVVRDNGQYFDWTCLGGSISPTCIQRKCEAGLTYCASTYECLSSCPNDGETATSSLIFGTRLSPRIVRDADSQCTLYWNVNATEDAGVLCTLNGTSISSDPSSVSRSVPVGIGAHTLSCTNGVEIQSTSTRCLLNASFKEI